MKVASRLEEEEKRQFLLTEHMMNQRFGFQTGIDPVSSTMADLINHRQINISFNAKKDDRGNMKTEVTYEELQTGVSRSDFPISNPGAFDPISELSDYERERYFQRVRSQDIMTRSVQYQLMMANRPIEKRIDPKLLEELIREEFVSNGILLDYEFVVKSYFQGNEKVFSDRVITKPIAKKNTRLRCLLTISYRKSRTISKFISQTVKNIFLLLPASWCFRQ